MKRFLFNFIKYGALAAFILATLVLLFEAAMPGKQSANHSNQVGDAISGTLDSIKGDNTKFKDVTEIKIANEFKANNNYSIGDELSIKAEIIPNDASNKSLTYSSSNPDAIYVNTQGQVTFLDEGSATITITSASNKDIQKTIKLTSNHVYPEEIEIEEIKNLYANSTHQLKVTLLPSNTTKNRLLFTSSDESVATVDDFGNIKTLTTGTVTIKVKTENDLEKEITLNVEKVKDVEVEEIQASDTISLYINELSTIEYQVYPENSANKSVEFTIADESILSINKGEIQGLNVGTTTLTISSKQKPNIQKTIIVNILPLPSVTSFEIDETINVIYAEKFNLNIVDITPSNADVSNIIYSDYDQNIISIENNIFHAHNIGQTKLTIQIGSCIKETIINVTEGDIIKLESLTVSNEANDLYVSESLALDVKLTPQDATFNKLIYQSSDNDIVEIDKNGNIKALQAGSATITITSLNYDEIYYSFNINVSNVYANNLDLNLDSTLYLGDTFTIDPIITSNNSLEVTYQEVNYSSSNSDILSIDENGFVTIKALGEVTITAHLEKQNNITYRKTITIKERLVEDIIVDQELTLFVNTPIKLDYSVTPNNAYNKDLTYQSNNTNILAIDNNGNITPIANGNCVITVKSISNPKIQKTILVKVEDIYPTSITINSELGTSVKEITAGISKQMSVSINSNATYKKVTYTSSNEEIAEIDDNGMIIAKYPGTVTITASTFDGEKQIETSFELTVNRQPAIADTTTFFYLVRKGIGHFGAFLCLALACTIMLMCFFRYHPAAITLSATIGFLIAGATELIQLFTPGRSGNWTDVGIDYFGYVSGIFLIYIVVFGIYFIKFIIRTKKNKKDFNRYDLHDNMFNRKIK